MAGLTVARTTAPSSVPRFFHANGADVRVPTRRCGGGNQTATSTASIITEPFQVTVGDDVFVVMCSGGGKTFSTATSTLGNTWTLDATLANGVSQATALFHSTITVAGVDTVTAVVSGATPNKTWTVYSVPAGVLIAAPLDQTSTNSGSTTTVTATTTGTLGQAQELAILAVGWVESASSVFIPDVTAWMKLEQDESNSGRAGSVSFQLTSSTSGVAASGALVNAPSPAWSALVATYKLNVPAGVANQTVSPPVATGSASALIPLPDLGVLSIAATATASSLIPIPALGVPTPVATASASALVPVPQLVVPPPVAAAAASAPVPTVTAAFVVAAPAATASASSPIPTLALAVPPAAATAAASAPSPVPQLRVSPAAATATASGPIPVPQLQVLAPVATASASALVPTVAGGQTVAPPAATASASAPIPAIQVQVPTPVATATASGPVPTVTSAIMVLPPAATATASSPLAAVKLQIAATLATAAATAPLPLVGVTLILPAATASASAKPVTISLTIAAPSATAAAAMFAPFVTAGALLLITAPFQSSPTAGVSDSPGVAEFLDEPFVGASSDPTSGRFG